MNKKIGKNIYLVLLLFAILPYDYSKLLFGKAALISNALIYGIRIYLFFYVLYYMKKLELPRECKKVFKYTTLYFLLIFALNIISSIYFDKTSVAELITRMFSMIYMYGFYTYMIYNYKHFDVFNSKIKIVCFILLLFSIILYIFFPEIGSQYEGYNSHVFLGVAANRNSYYELMMPAIVSILFLKKEKIKFWDTILIFTITLTTVATKSVTSIFGLAIFYILLLFGRFFKNKTTFLKTSYILIVLVWLLFFVSLINNSYINRFSSLFSHKSSTLSGRTIIWEKSIYFIKQNPVIGYGYDNNLIGDTTNYTLQNDNIFPNDTHNSVIFMLLSSGIIGTISLLYIIFITAKNSIYVVKYDGRFFYLTAFILANLFRGLTESCFHYPHAIFSLYMIVINIRYNELVSKKRLEI